jgi:hypothetical protein
MALGLLVSLRLPCATSLFTAPTTLLARRSVATPAAGLIVAAALLPVIPGFRLCLRLRLGPLPLCLRLSTLLPTASTLRFAAFSALLFATTRAVGLFAAAAPLFRAFGPLMGMISPTPLCAGFRVGAGDRDVGQGKRTPDGDRAALSASVS